MRRFPEAPQDRGELARVRRLDLDDELSAVEEQDPVRLGGNGGLVGHHHDGLTKLIHGLAEQADDRLRGVRVERCGGLVGEDHLWSCDQRPGDRHALLLAPRQRSGKAPQLASDADALGELLDVAPVDVTVVEAERQRDVLRHREARDEVERLEHEADSLATQYRQLAPAQAVEVGTAEAHGARRRTVKAGGNLEEG